MIRVRVRWSDLEIAKAQQARELSFVGLLVLINSR
jgi:hypothetical protein